MNSSSVTIRPVATKKDRKAFVDFAWEVYKKDPNWVPPLKDEVHGLITPGKNPWFEHARAQLWLAERDGKVVGRISAQVDDLVQQPDPKIAQLYKDLIALRASSSALIYGSFRLLDGTKDHFSYERADKDSVFQIECNLSEEPVKACAAHSRSEWELVFSTDTGFGGSPDSDAGTLLDPYEARIWRRKASRS